MKQHAMGNAQKSNSKVGMPKLNANHSYAFCQVADLIQDQYPTWSRSRIRTFLIRVAEAFAFPQNGDENVILHGVMTVPTWYGNRWTIALDRALAESEYDAVSPFANKIMRITGYPLGIVLPFWTLADAMTRDRIVVLADVVNLCQRNHPAMTQDKLITLGRLRTDSFEYMGIGTFEERWMVYLPIFRRWYESWLNKPTRVEIPTLQPRTTKLGKDESVCTTD